MTEMTLACLLGGFTGGQAKFVERTASSLLALRVWRGVCCVLPGVGDGVLCKMDPSQLETWHRSLIWCATLSFAGSYLSFHLSRAPTADERA